MLKTSIIILVAFSIGFVANEYWHQQQNRALAGVETQLPPIIDNASVTLDLDAQAIPALNLADETFSQPNNLLQEDFLWNRIEQMMANNQLAEAIKLLHAELDKNPASAKAWLSLAKAYQALGNHREAVINWLHYLQYEMDVQKRDDARAQLKNYLLKLVASTTTEFDNSWLAQQLNAFIQLTTDDPELHLATAGLYAAVNDSYQAQYHALMAANNSATQERAEVILAQLNGTHLTDDLILPLTRFGNQFLVSVDIEGHPARLLLDTGASLSGVSTHYVAKYPGIVKTTKPIRLNTASGVVDSYLFTVNQLNLGDVVFNQHILAKLPLDVTTEFDGLLGVDILGRFNFVIDQNEAILRLGKRR